MTNFEYHKGKFMEITKNNDLQCDECPARKNCESDGFSSCSVSLVRWGLKEYEPPKQKRHTVQEIVDFFGKPASCAKNGNVYIYSKKPKFKNNYFDLDSTAYIFALIPSELISDSLAFCQSSLILPAESNE